MATAPPFWPAGLPLVVKGLPPTLNATLRHSAKRRPGHVALAFYGAEITYATLLSRVEALAGFLQHRCGVAQGDRVLLDMQNSPHFVIAYHAILRAGAVVVPVSPMSLPEEIAYFAADSGARVALLGAELFDRFAPLLGTGLRYLILATYGDEVPDPAPFRLPQVVAARAHPMPPKGCFTWQAAIAEGLVPRPDVTTSGDLCVMPYTSGTTGRSKACMHSHAGTVFTAFAQAAWYGFDDASVVSGFMPLFHVAGMQVSMNGGIAAGITIVLMARWDPGLIVPLFLRYGVTLWSAAPTMVVDVLGASDFDPRAFARLRTLTGGGASMPAAVAEELERRWGLRFVEGYGLSETIAATHLNPPDRPKPQCLGIPIQQTESRIIDPDTLAELPVGETGEIIIAGPQIMRGYWQRPEADAEVFLHRDGKRFLRTGDLGYRDAEGYWFIVDRLKRMVNVSGNKVWPAELEATLYRHPAIQECCVIAVPDARSGEAVKALIVRRAGMALTADDLRDWARGLMAAYKVPKHVAFVDALPRSGTSKIDWRRLQDAERMKA
ncbi:long-chain-fatty-acid--CoA ligase [Humitalea sp. 24SJ18S-53]|uniref:long-chain-fatty-acid--CoA ligase n=1 Tax=Humitalea sp. 24SJ18S-53 TaxID=3422307 RepID=UPI003D674B16